MISYTISINSETSQASQTAQEHVQKVREKIIKYFEEGKRAESHEELYNNWGLSLPELGFHNNLNTHLHKDGRHQEYLGGMLAVRDTSTMSNSPSRTKSNITPKLFTTPSTSRPSSPSDSDESTTKLPAYETTSTTNLISSAIVALSRFTRCTAYIYF